MGKLQEKLHRFPLEKYLFNYNIIYYIIFKYNNICFSMGVVKLLQIASALIVVRP